MVEAKRALRAEALERRARQSAWLRSLRSRRVARRAIGLSAFASANIVLAYFPIGAEVDTRFIMKWCFRTGRAVALPRITGDRRNRELVFHLVRNLDGLRPGPFGILQPMPESGEIIHPARADVIIVPGLVFSPSGDRLGYGGGYYDTVLAKTRAVSVGVVFECQVRGALPHGPRDIPVRAIVTDRRTIIPGSIG